MKRISWLVGVILLALCGLVFFNWMQGRETGREPAKLETLWGRQLIARDLTLSFEKYRRLSGQFRKYSEAQVAATKDSLRSEVSKAVTELEAMDPTPEEKELGQKLKQQVADFMVLSAKLEPMLFLRDVFFKPEAVAAHEDMLKTIRAIDKSAERRKQEIRDDRSSSRNRWIGLSAMAAVAASVAAALLLLNIFLSYIRPMRALLARAREIQSGKLRRDTGSSLKGEYREVETSMDELAAVMDSHQRERQGFVTAIVSDLRAPLAPLQTSAALLAAPAGDILPEQKSDASHVIRRCVTRLSRVLEDLSDTLSAQSGRIHLDEKLVDLRDLVKAVVASVTGPGGNHDVKAVLPQTAVWAFIDGAKFERVVANLVGKIMQFCPQGGQINISLSALGELKIYESFGDKQGAFRATGPEQELMKHWISENGIGMELAQRIVEAHGGLITAAGVAGTSVIFTMKLPEDRVAARTPSRAAGFKPAVAEGQRPQQQQQQNRTL